MGQRDLRQLLITGAIPGEPALLPASERVLHHRRGTRRDLVQPQRPVQPERRGEGGYRRVPVALQRLRSRWSEQARAARRKPEPFSRRRHDLLCRQEHLRALGHRRAGDACADREHGRRCRARGARRWRSATTATRVPIASNKLLKLAAKGKVEIEAKTLIVADEAGMLSTRRTTSSSSPSGAKVVFAGDTRQQQPVEAGQGQPERLADEGHS